MIKFDMSKFRESFKIEACELFDNIEELLLNIEKKGDITNIEIKELFRLVHTLKGGGSSVGYTYFSKFVHEFETLLDKMRSGDIIFEAKMAELFIEFYDIAKELFDLEIESKIDRNSYIQLTSKSIEKIQVLIRKAKVELKHIEPTNGSFGFFDEKYKDLKALFKHKEHKTVESKNFGFFDEVYSIKHDKNIEKNEHENIEIKIETKEQETKIETHPPFIIIEEVSENLNSEIEVVEAKQELIKSKDSQSTIRVNLSKIDALMNNIGEVVIAMSMLSQYTQNIKDLKIKNGFLEKIGLIERHIRDLRESVISTRMVPMESIYSKFPKQIRDIGKKLNKEIELKTFGDSVEIDKAMIEGLNDPLMHIIRNACDHGLELSEERVRVGKSKVGTITLGAEQSNGQIIISVSDDGAGIDINKVSKKALESGIITKERLNQLSEQDMIDMIFEAGLSTAKSVTDISGRGVGMDVVRSNITKLGGMVKIESKRGVGTKFIISLPLTLAILEGLNITVGEQSFILPLSSIVESLQPTKTMIRQNSLNSEEILILREEILPIVRLHKIFSIKPKFEDLCEGMIIIVKVGVSKMALFIDMFLTQQQVVIKPIEKNFRQVKGLSGATVRGDGSIGLILDLAGIYNIHKEQRQLYGN